MRKKKDFLLRKVSQKCVKEGVAARRGFLSRGIEISANTKRDDFLIVIQCVPWGAIPGKTSESSAVGGVSSVLGKYWPQD